MSCSSLLHEARKKCSLFDEECLKEQRVFASKETSSCANPTRCLVPGSTDSYYVCLSDTSSPADQTVHGLPKYGTPTKLVKE
jgi:hypothetical protein